MHGDTALADLPEIMQVGDTDADSGAPADKIAIMNTAITLLVVSGCPASDYPFGIAEFLKWRRG